jgi:hypothetical protein
MIEVENLKDQTIFYREGSTMPETVDPSSTSCITIPSYVESWPKRIPKNTANPLNCSAKNISYKRFRKARAKAKVAKKSRKRNRKK